MKLRASFALFRCSRCRKSYSSPLGHVCVSNRNTPRRTRLAVRATVTRSCPKCGKPANNPLTHVCVVRSDFKRRKAAAEKRAKSARRAAAPKHLYQSCADKDCKRLPCLAWKEGRAEGYDEGYQEGHEAGYALGHGKGYAAGYAAGAASC